jgi:hypothetical protein
MENVKLVQVTVKIAQLLTLVIYARHQKFLSAVLVKSHAHQLNMLMQMEFVNHVIFIVKFAMVHPLVLNVIMDCSLLMVFVYQNVMMELSQVMANVNLAPRTVKLVSA